VEEHEVGFEVLGGDLGGVELAGGSHGSVFFVYPHLMRIGQRCSPACSQNNLGDNVPRYDLRLQNRINSTYLLLAACVTHNRRIGLYHD
jgi:hypothetical protein